MSADDPWMRLRVWVCGNLVDDVWVDTSRSHAQEAMVRVRAAHVTLVAVAEKRGDPWLVEIYDPARPEGEAYLRFGSDAIGMVQPGGDHPWAQEHPWLRGRA